MTLAVNVSIAAKKKWDRVQTSETTAKIAKEAADAANVRAQSVLAVLPETDAEGSAVKARDAAAVGVIRLINLARENGVAVSSISPASKAGGQSGTAIDQIATSVPMTDGGVRRVHIKMNIGFSSLDALTNFIGAIPTSGGYLSRINIGKDRADLSIRFVGV